MFRMLAVSLCISCIDPMSMKIAKIELYIPWYIPLIKKGLCIKLFVAPTSFIVRIKNRLE